MSIQAAQTYTGLGWSCIPVASSKAPSIQSWQEFQRRRPTDEELRAWFGNGHHNNIAVVTGQVSGLIVIDIDVHKGGNVDEVLKAAPTEMVVQTGTGGYHLYYTYPVDFGHIGNRVDLFKGVDVRAEGGYVVAPPSIHSNGQPYRWVKHGKPGSVLPILHHITRTQKSDVAPDNKDSWLSEALNGVSHGSRDHTGARLVGYYLSKGIPLDVVRTLMHQWNEKNEPPLRVSDIDRIVDSVYSTTNRNQSGAEDNSPKLELMPMSDYARKHGNRDVEWCIEGWLPDATIAMVVAPPESYKTWLLLDAAISVATGVDFLGQFPVTKPGPVLLFQQEDSHSGLADRLSTIMAGKFGGIEDLSVGDDTAFQFTMWPEIPIYVHPNRELRFNDGSVMDLLESHVARIRPRIVIIDPLYSAAATDNYMADVVNDMFRLKRMRDEYGTTFIVAHHTKKRSEKDGQREDAWGSQFLNAFLEAGWQVRQATERAHIIVQRHFKIAERPAPLTLRWDINDQDQRYAVEILVPSDDPTPEGVLPDF